MAALPFGNSNMLSLPSSFQVLDPDLGSPFEIISFKKAAAIAGYSYPGWVKLNRRGNGPAVIQFEENKYGVRLRDLDDWLAARRGVLRPVAA